MPFCNDCGAKHDEGAKFCSSCGKKLAAGFEQKPSGENAAGEKSTDGKSTEEKNKTANDGGAKEGSGQNSAGASGVEGFINKITDTPDASDEFDKADAEANKAMAILAYIGILVLVPLIGAKESKFARYHTNQGLIFFLSWIIAGVAQAIMSTLFGLLRLWFLVTTINFFISLAVLAFMIIGIYNAATGRARELPFIGQFKIYKY